MIFTYLGYGCGIFAPGITDLKTMFIVAHTVIRAHARAWHTYDRDFKPTQSGLCYCCLLAGSIMVTGLLTEYQCQLQFYVSVTY